MKKIILILVVLVIAALILPAAVLAAPVGKITALEGKVDMTAAGAKDAVPVAVGVSVNAGDILRAKSKSKAEITFPDGNILRLAENTRVRVTQYQPEEGKKSYVNLFRGKTVAVVDKLKKGSNFEVHTPTAICGVRGTVFYSSYQSGQSSFVFQSGAGYGYNINRPDQVVAIPPKVFMVIQAADKAPLLRPATDVEIDKHQKDTTLAGKPKEDGKKEEEKKPDSLKAATDEGKPKEEKKEEQAKPKAEDKKGGAASGSTADTGSGTSQPQSPATASAPVTDAATQTINQVLLTEKQPVPESTLLITTPPVTQPIKSETVVQKDNTPPDISFTLTPPSLTKDTSASFSYNSNEKVDYQYRLNSGAWQIGPSSTQSGSTTIAVPADGNNTFEIKATDSGGNFTTKTYSWTTDNTGPVVTIAPQAAFPTGDTGVDVDVKLTSNEGNTSYLYKTDTDSDYQSTDPSFTRQMEAGDRTIFAHGKDQLGNVGSDATNTFALSRHDVVGTSWSSLDGGGGTNSPNVVAKFAGVSNQSWGSWQLSDNGAGTPSASWTYYAGNYDNSNFAYWLDDTKSATASGGKISGSSSEMIYLTKSVLGTGSSGILEGTYGNDAWSITDTGRGIYTEKPVVYWGVQYKFSDNWWHWNNSSKTWDATSGNDLRGMLAGTSSLWSGSSSFTGLGNYYNPGSDTLWRSRIDSSSASAGDSTNYGRFRGWTEGIVKSNNILESFGYYFYIKNLQPGVGPYETGYIYSKDGTGKLYPGISMWKLSGTLNKVEMGTTTHAPDDLNTYTNYRSSATRSIYGENGNITGTKKNYVWDLDGQNWNIIFSDLGGNYQGTISPTSWQADIGGVDQDGNSKSYNYAIAHIDGNAWTSERIAARSISGRSLSWTADGTVIDGSMLGNIQSESTKVWQAQALTVQQGTPLKFAALVGNWTDDSGGREGSNLYYTRTPAYTMTSLEVETKTPTRIGLTWNVANMDMDTHAWIPPYQANSSAYHIFKNNMGSSRTPYRYPYAYLDKNDTTGATGENLYNFMFQKGDTYYAVYKYSTGSDVGSTTQIFNRTQKYDGWNETLLSGADTSNTLTDTTPWWYVYKIHLNTNDPEETPTIYRVNVLDTEAPNVLRYVADDGNISGILGSTKSFIQEPATTNLPLRLMGDYTYATNWNRIWAQELVAYNANKQKYITYDDQPGTFFGTLAGTFLPGQKKVGGYLYAFTINPTGQSDILKGSFGTDGDLGTVYPGLSMWEADGKATKYEMNVGSGITPGSLSTGRWYYVAPAGGATDSPFEKTSWISENDYLGKIHLSSWRDPKSYEESNNSWGMFANSTLTKPTDYMTSREDYLDAYRLKNDTDTTFGVWGWRALGQYQTKDAKWFLSSNLKLQDNSYYGTAKLQLNLFAYGGAWADSQFTGHTIGYLGDGMRGFTGVIAGDTNGTYNDTPDGTSDYVYNTFGAVSAGSWINTNRFIQMLDDAATGGGKEKLSALGYPTTAYTNTTSFPGDLASNRSSFVTMSNLRILNAPNHDIVRIYATDSVSSQQGTSLTKGAIYAVTGASESLPFYGRVTPEYTETHEGQMSTWIGYFHGIGVFTKTDGSYVQGAIDGPVAGTYGLQFFSGTSAGEWRPAPFLSELKDADKIYLKYVNPCGWDLYKDEGYIKGLLGATEPLAWTDNVTYPDYTQAQLTGVWVPGTGGTTTRSHIFETSIYPRNFEAGGYTTTKGASYWGTLSGIHQYRSESSQDGMEALMTTIFVDANKNYGFLYGRIGGPENEASTNYWGFDRTNQAFSIDSHRDRLNVIKVGTTTTTTASSLKSVMEDSANHTQYTYRGGVMSDSIYLIGKFFDASGNPLGNLNLGNPERPDPAMQVTGLVDAWSLPDSSDTRSWAIWQTKLYGTYNYSGTPEYWLGEVQTPDSSSPTHLMGSKLIGERWADNRTTGATIGFWANIGQAGAATGISIGNFVGTFDPSQYTYQAVASGGSLETSKFLAMVGTPIGSVDRETLRSLNIPCVNVGMATLAGENSNLAVRMTDVKFFAYATGATPHIWATNSVEGQSKVADLTNRSVSIAGNGLQANFTMKTWNTTDNKWMATVNNGQGSITGGGTNVQNLNFRGGAAGNISGSNFSGTGAGVVKQVQPVAR